MATVWAMDLGNNSLKALRLSDERGVVEVTGFDNIQHGKILNGSGVTAAERDELTALSLRRFVRKNNLSKDDVVVCVPSQNSFARFVKLPPVEPKRIPEIVRFEAAQQIPFDINEVQWDWQLMTKAGSGETKVGIFAIKSEVVSSALEHFGRENITVRYVQMAPMALYNYVLYDRTDLGRSANQAIVVLDIGAENTDLVVCTRSTVWQRCIPMGGNAFTRAVADTFKLNFEKAEKLKRTAPMSKYARQIFQAMRPVFTDLASEIQRSLGFYKSSNPNTKLLKIITLGGGTKMRGLLKYLQQSLQIPVERPDSFKRLAIGPGVSAAKFHENVSDFGTVYGLALQGLGLARIRSNLLPRSIARSMAWVSKAKYFTAAACVLLLVSVLSFARTFFDNANYRNKEDIRRGIESIINTAEQARDDLEAQRGKGADSEAIIAKGFEPFKYRDVVPLLIQSVISTLPNKKNNPEQKGLYEAFAKGDVKEVLKVPRKERKQIFVTNMSVYFTDDIQKAQFINTEEIIMGRRRGGTGGEFYDDEHDWVDEEDEDDEYEDEDGEFTEFIPEVYGIGGDEKVVEEVKSGFVVAIAGYSPYKNIGELIDPVGVGDDKSKWGVVTRLLNLDEFFDGDSLFELYKKSDAQHFGFEKDPVSIGVEMEVEHMPAGIGLVDVRFEGTTTRGPVEYREEGQQVLIDPMTKEIISKVAELDESGEEKVDRSGNVVYNANDYWFILNLKFVWKDAPEQIERTEEVYY